MIIIFSPQIVLAENYNFTENKTGIYVTVKPINQITVQSPDNKDILQAIKNLDKGNNSWTQGDIIITSGTIFAFFAFSSFLGVRFESKMKKELVSLTEFILGLTGGIQILHLFVIITIMYGAFTPTLYSFIISATVIILVLILVIVRQIVIFENMEEEKEAISEQSFLKLKDEIIKENVAQEVERRLDDLRRERNKFTREQGE